MDVSRAAACFLYQNSPKLDASDLDRVMAGPDAAGVATTA
jgi:hypothetical protein